MLIEDQGAPAFSLAEPLYAKQLARGCRLNALVRGQWGCWWQLPPTATAATAATAAALSASRCRLSPSLPLSPLSASPLRHVVSCCRLDGVDLEFLCSNPAPGGPACGHVDYVGRLGGLGGLGGRLVMGVGQCSSDSRRPRLDPLLRWPVPDQWAPRDAATVPFVYAVVSEGGSE